MVPWLECGGGIQLPFPETNIKGYKTVHAWYGQIEIIICVFWVMGLKI